MKLFCYFQTIYVFLPFAPLSRRMRTHIMLEPPSPMKPGDLEKVSGIYEEWRGNPLLDEKTCSLALLGKLHIKFRDFNGYMTTQCIKHGIL